MDEPGRSGDRREERKCIREPVFHSPKKKRRKQALGISEKHTILNIYKEVTENWPQGSYPYSSVIVNKTAETGGVSRATVYKILKEYNETRDVKSPPPRKRKSSKFDKLDDITLGGIRRKIHHLFFKNELPTLDKVLTEVNADDTLPNFSRSGLYRVLKNKLKFKYAQRSRKSMLIDKNEIVVLRVKYLQEIRKMRNEGKKIYCTDETWLNEVDLSSETSKEEKNNQQSNRNACLVVRNISFQATEETLREHFEPYGEILEVELLKKPNGKLVGCAFVHFKNVPMAKEALLNTNMKPFLGRPVSVDWAVAKDKYMKHVVEQQLQMQEEVKKEDSDSDDDPLNTTSDTVKAKIKSESEDDSEKDVKSEDEDDESGSDDVDDDNDASNDEDDDDDEQEDENDLNVDMEDNENDNESVTPERQLNMDSRVRASPEQLFTLLQYMETHGDLARPLASSQGLVRSDRLWSELTNILNSVGGGVSKTTDKWKKVWADWKSKTKKKGLAIRRHGNGSGPASGQTLSAIEKRVLSIMGNLAVEGQASVEELGFTRSQSSAQGDPVTQAQEDTRFLEIVDETSQLTNSPQPSTSKPWLLNSTSQMQTPPLRCAALAPPSSQSPPSPPAPAASTAPRPPVPGTSASSPSVRRLPQSRMRARRRRAPTLFETVELRRLELEEGRMRLQHERDMRALDVEHERNEVLRSVVEVARDWLDHIRSRDNTERLNTG